MADETAEVDGRAKRGIRRDDPPPRPVEQTANRGYLQGADPSKHYVWVSDANDPTINVGFYKSLGYKVAQYDPDEARPTLGYSEFQQNDPIKSMGMTLMECSVERKRQLDERGWDGNGGWKLADRIQETIKNRDVDPQSEEEKRAFRGITSVRDRGDDRKKWQF